MMGGEYFRRKSLIKIYLEIKVDDDDDDDDNDLV
jgi:hypothetical protein